MVDLVMSFPGTLHGISDRTLYNAMGCEKAASGPSFEGVVKDFCRNKGHGFIEPKDGGEPLFCHISDIDGDYVPKAGDIVRYKTHLIPPKNEKMQAVHVEIIHPAKGVQHETWEGEDALRS